MSIYNQERNLFNAERRIRNETYSDEHKEALLKFEDYLYSESLSLFRIEKHLSQINVIIRTFPDLKPRGLNDDDVIRVLGWIEKTKTNIETNTSYKTTLKKYLAFQKSPELCDLVKIKKRKTNPKLPEEILTVPEIKQLITAATNSRDKAFITGIYEAGARITEFGTLKIKHVVFDEYGIKLTVNGKTGMRVVRLVFSVPYLINWLEVHPFRDDPEAPLWVTDLKAGFAPKQMMYGGFDKLIKKTALLAGIKKRIYNQIFRHSRATHTASKLSESQMKIVFGWTADSDMPKIYIHLSGEDVDDAVLNMYGLKKTDSPELGIGIKRCARCKQNIPSISDFCPVCSMIQNTETAQELQDFESKAKNLMFRILKENPELIKILEEIQN